MAKEAKFSLKRLDKKILIGGIIVVCIGLYFVFFGGLGGSKRAKYDELQKEYAQIMVTVQEKSMQTAKGIQEEDWSAIEENSKALVSEAEKAIAIDEELIILSKTLNFEKGNRQIQKRKEVMKSMLAAFEKIHGCTEFKLAGQEQEFKKCDQEALPLFNRFTQLSEEYKEEFE